MFDLILKLIFVIFLVDKIIFVSPLYKPTFSTRRPKTPEELQLDKDFEECRKMEDSPLHPLDCCDYPRYEHGTPEQKKNCSDNCRTVPYPEFRCVFHCVIFDHTRVIYEKNKTNTSALIQSFWKAGEEDFVTLPDEWVKVVLESAKECEKEVPGDAKPPEIPSDADGIFQFNYYYYNKIVECVRKYNFINCPNMSKKPECETMKKQMELCPSFGYDFTHKMLFEVWYYRNKTEEARKANGSTDPPDDPTTAKPTKLSEDSAKKADDDKKATDPASTAKPQKYSNAHG